MIKKCKECQELKSLELFYNNSETKDGKEGTCKSCRNDHNKFWARHNPLKCKLKTYRYRAKKANQSQSS